MEILPISGGYQSYIHYLSSTHSGPCRWDPRKTGTRQQTLRIITVSSPSSLEYLIKKERENFTVAIPFKIQTPVNLVLGCPGIANLFSLQDNYYHLVCFVLCPENFLLSWGTQIGRSCRCRHLNCQAGGSKVK